MSSISTKRSITDKKLTGSVLLKEFSEPHMLLLKKATCAGVAYTVFLCIMWVSFAVLVEGVVINQESLTQHNSLIILFVLAALLKVSMLRLQTLYGDRASSFIRNDVRKKILTLWRNQSPLVEHQQSPASAATQWVEDIEAMDGYFSKYWPQKILAVASPLIILSVVAYINWLCALLLLISAPLIPLFMALIGMGAERINEKHSLTRQRLAGHFLNRVANLTTIKLLNSESQIFDEVESRSTHYRKIIMKTLRVAFLSSTVLEFFTSVAIASLAIYIGFSLYGAITWGPAADITLFSGLLILILAPEFFQPLRTLSQYYHDKATALGAANNLVELFDSSKSLLNKAVSRKSTVNSPNIVDLPRTCVPRVTLNKVSIGHSVDSVLATKVSFDLTTNQLMVITGGSGTGKTTLLNTIAHYLPPLEGQIHIHPKIGERDLYGHSSMSYLPQKPWIKNATVLANITEFAPTASNECILSCLSTLGLADEFENRPTGLNTMLGEHGQGFSGGQLQRIALCRVLLDPTPIILLDEPTAKLDIQSKEFILTAIKKLRKNAIVILATHDPLLLEIADGHLCLDSQPESSDAVLV